MIGLCETVQWQAAYKGCTEHQQGCGVLHDLRTKSLSERPSPASPQNPLQTTDQPGDKSLG